MYMANLELKFSEYVRETFLENGEKFDNLIKEVAPSNHIGIYISRTCTRIVSDNM